MDIPGFDAIKKALKWADVVDRVKALEQEVADLKANYQPTKFCGCCDEPQRLKRTGGTLKKCYYSCPITEQRYFFKTDLND